MSNYDNYMKAVAEFKRLTETSSLADCRLTENKLIDTWFLLTPAEQELAKVERLK